MTNQITISDIAIHRDSKGRYSLNDLHQASGHEQRHRPKYWLELQQTNDLINEILKGAIPPFNLLGNSNSTNSQGLEPVISKSGRYGGTYVCKELVYSYAMWISAAFALKVIRAYDALVSGHLVVKPKARQCTATQLTPLRQKAEHLITTGLGKIYPDIWKLVHRQFGVEHINQLQPEQVSEAIEYLNVLEGEYLGRSTAPAFTSTKTLTDKELCTLCWLWHYATHMAEYMAQVYPILRVAEHRLAPVYLSMSTESPRTLNAAREVLLKETTHIEAGLFCEDNWRVLYRMRNAKEMRPSTEF